jgi:hypothetical protein
MSWYIVILKIFTWILLRSSWIWHGNDSFVISAILKYLFSYKLAMSIEMKLPGILFLFHNKDITYFCTLFSICAGKYAVLCHIVMNICYFVGFLMFMCSFPINAESCHQFFCVKRSCFMDTSIYRTNYTGNNLQLWDKSGWNMEKTLFSLMFKDYL